MINYYIAAVLWSFDIKNPYAQYLYFLAYLAGTISWVKYPSTKKTLVFIVVLFSLLLSIQLTPSVFEAITGPIIYQSQISSFALLYLPIFILSLDKYFDYNEAIDYLSKYSIYIVFLCIIAYVCQVFISGQGLQEYMSFAYTGLTAILLCFYYSWKNNSIPYLLFSVAGILTVVFGGCRGALLTVLLFLAIYLLLSLESKNKKIFFVGLIVVAISLLPQLFSIAEDILTTFGFESRIFQLLEAGEVAESDGRMRVYLKAISLINLMGNGIFSDRVLLDHIDDAIYCHNWILEILVDFGWIIGGLIILYVLFKLVRILVLSFSIKDKTYIFMTSFTIAMLFGKYMLSNSYLNSYEIPLILGWLLIKYSSNKAISY